MTPRDPSAATGAAIWSAGRVVSTGDGLPALHVAMRFFVTAAAFGAAAGGLWCTAGEPAFVSRWTPTMLAATHLLTLGFFTMVAFGALFQVVPVLGGGGLPRATLVASVAHPTLAAGTASLAMGLGGRGALWFVAAIACLALAFAVFAAAVGSCLLRSRAIGLRPLRFAMLGFLGTVVLGFLMASGAAWPSLGMPYRNWTDTHAGWGGLGFLLLLVVGVSHQVLPMFHVTPPFGRAAVRWTAPTIVAGLLLQLVPGAMLPSLGTVLVAGAGAWHVVAALRLLARRRRRRADATVLAWQFGLGAVAIGLLAAAIDGVLPTPSRPSTHLPSFHLALGLLLGLGGLGTIVLGMLTKIVPFLAFLHLQRLGLRAATAGKEPPSMGAFVGRHTALAQVVLHLCATALVIVAAFAPAWGRLAGGLLALDFVFCFAFLSLAWHRYRCAAKGLGGTKAAPADSVPAPLRT